MNNTQSRNYSLDGLRGMAALLVLLDHTGYFVGVGAKGVALFFVLSGYLLAIPFVKNKINTLENGLYYLLRRLLRILPMYIFYVVLVGLWEHLGNNWMISHLIFERSDGHLWSVKQELCLYLILPTYFLIIYTIRKKPLLCAILALVIATLCDIFLTRDVLGFTSPTPGIPMRLHVAPFFIGIATAYFECYLQYKKITYRHSDILIITLLSIAFYIANMFLEKPQEYIISFIFMIIILGIPYIPIASITHKILTANAFRAIGIIGYSFYLLHWIVRDEVILHTQNVYFITIIVIGITYVMSYITYRTIELPFMSVSKIFK